MTRCVVVLAILGAGFLLLPMLGLNNDPSADGQEKTRSSFAGDRAPAEVTPAKFDGKRAMSYIQAICDIGPRMSATPGMRKQQDLIRKHFESLGLKVESQTYSAKQISRARAVDMTNLIVKFNPEKSRRIILCSHYDTRPIADQEPDPRKWRETFLSANDGGSGVAFLMELAHHMKDMKLDVGVDFVLFDGEEFFFQKGDEYFFGSKHFAKTWVQNKRQPNYVAAVLLDMIAGDNAKFPVEENSWVRSPELCKSIWAVAKELRCDAFQERIGDRVSDDHIPLQNAGMQAIDIIDFDYQHWHRLSDTPENCSPDGMIQVSKVLTTWMQRLK
ncbi:MAG: M28 family peptidase [Planctomycetes bacterium]|nr:M28 family peptidase [Planctomycetota bacterium]